MTDGVERIYCDNYTSLAKSCEGLGVMFEGCEPNMRETNGAVEKANSIILQDFEQILSVRKDLLDTGRTFLGRPFLSIAARVSSHRSTNSHPRPLLLCCLESFRGTE